VGKDYEALCNEVCALWNRDVSTAEIMARLDLKHLSAVSDIVRHSRIEYNCPAKKRYNAPNPGIPGGYLSMVAAYYLRFYGADYTTISAVLKRCGYSRSAGALRTGLVARKGKPLKYKNSAVLYDRESNQKEHNYVSFSGDIEGDIASEDANLFRSLQVYKEAWKMLKSLKGGE
jgi:hypothetical protein